MSETDHENETTFDTLRNSTIRGEYWKNDISVQFPVHNIIENENDVLATVGAPHEGYTIQTKLVNNKLNGDSTILNPYQVRIATLTYVDGAASGKCSLYDECGILFFSGSLVNGFRSGKGEEYDTQTGFGSKKPDATIFLPDNKAVFIDAKTSLASYDAYINAQNEEEAQNALKQFKDSVKTHIAGLSKREYFEIEEYTSPEYVLMFIPVESCYSMLFADNGELWELAWKNKIMPVSPSTLLAALKIINSFNMVNRQNKNAQEIAALAGKMIDKFADMVKDLNGIQTNLSRAMTKLAGRDNVIRQCERLTELGAKNAKQIPEPAIIEEQLEVVK